ncbi:MAG: hypothetical protein ABIE74_00330 [Pseudomonadota bacterium]
MKMKGNFKIVVNVCVAVVILCLQSCGGGGGAPVSPVGLFTEPPADISTNPPTDKELSNFFGLVVHAKDLINAGIPVKHKSNVVVIIRQSVDDALYNKEFGKYLDLSCEEVKNNMMEKICVQTADSTKITSHMYFDEYEEDHAFGTVNFAFDFNGYYFDDVCGQLVSVEGQFQCDFNFDISYENNLKTSDFSGICNTSNDSDKYLSMTSLNGTHLSGFDLAINYSNSSEKMTGIISIDNTNYNYEDCDKLMEGKCSQSPGA